MEICQEKCINKDRVDHVSENLPEYEAIQDVASIFKALSEPGRLRIVIALLYSELCVCDLAAVCGMSESAVSHQLRILRNLRMVRNRREGKIVYYRPDDDHVINLIRNSIKHVAPH